MLFLDLAKKFFFNKIKTRRRKKEEILGDKQLQPNKGKTEGKEGKQQREKRRKKNERNEEKEN